MDDFFRIRYYTYVPDEVVHLSSSGQLIKKSYSARMVTRVVLSEPPTKIKINTDRDVYQSLFQK